MSYVNLSKEDLIKLLHEKDRKIDKLEDMNWHLKHKVKLLENENRSTRYTQSLSKQYQVDEYGVVHNIPGPEMI